MEEGYLAEIRTWAANFAPRCWAFCEGQTIAIQNNEALFSLLGTQYGGDGRTNFKLPDLRPDVVEYDYHEDSKKVVARVTGKRPWRDGEVRQLICMQGLYPSRS